MEACGQWTRAHYGSPSRQLREESRGYDAPQIKRLVSFDVWLNDTGHCFRVEGQEAIEACQSTYLDIVGGRDRTGLTTEGKVVQACNDESIDDGAPIMVP
jgi:hypothetical protein